MDKELKELSTADQNFLGVFTKNFGLLTHHVFNIDLLPFQLYTLNFLFNKTFVLLIATRGYSKSFMLATYAICRCILTPRSKVIIVSSSFRQAKITFGAVEKIYDKAPLLRQCCSALTKQTDYWELKFTNSSSIICIPLGDGNKVRGLRATHVLADEAFAIPSDILDVVIRGFAAVSRDPVETVRELERKKKMAEMGLISEEEARTRNSNQIILSTTAFFQFNHIYKRYLQYKKIIENKIVGKAPEFLGSDDYVNYNDYGIMQMSYEDLPDGVLDIKQISNARLTMPEILFNQEYKSVFMSDTAGFFRRSLLESASANFGVLLKRNADKRYVFGIDPARSSGANFSIAILEVDGNVARIRFVWTTHSTSFTDTSRKIRQLVKLFEPEYIACDLGGGGQTLRDLLCDKSMIPTGEEPIVEIDAEIVGKHILELVTFNPQWISSINFTTKSDLESKRLLFPNFPGEAEVDPKDQYYLDKVDDAFQEILFTKDEMAKIEISQTKMGAIHFDLPQNSPRSARKDRYSSLLLANYAAHKIRTIKEENRIELPTGGWPEDIKRR